jgi:Na+-transporting NADH:ubiquinone oxidoreductase subunit NqrE
METEQLFKTLKIVVIVALILGVIGAVFYLIYGFTILWQAMAAGIITGFLLILVFIFLILAVYLWLKLMLMKRELVKCRKELMAMSRKSAKDDEANNE